MEVSNQSEHSTSEKAKPEQLETGSGRGTSLVRSVGISLAGLALSGCTLFGGKHSGKAIDPNGITSTLPFGSDPDEDPQNPQRDHSAESSEPIVEPLWRKHMHAEPLELPPWRTPKAEAERDELAPLGTGPSLPPIPEVGEDKSPAQLREEIDGPSPLTFEELSLEGAYGSGGDFRLRNEIKGDLRLTESGELSFETRSDLNNFDSDTYRGRHVVGIGPYFNTGTLPELNLGFVSLFGEEFKVHGIATYDVDRARGVDSVEGGVRFDMGHYTVDLTGNDREASLTTRLRLNLAEGLSARLFHQLDVGFDGQGTHSYGEMGLNYRLNSNAFLFYRSEFEDVNLSDGNHFVGIGWNF